MVYSQHMTTCHYCGRTITEVYELPVEVNGILESMYVGRECLEAAAAEGYDNPQRVR